MAEEAHDDLKVVEETLPNPEENPRNKRFNEIAAEENQHKKDGEELVDVADETKAQAEPIGDTGAEHEKKAEEPQKFKIKVNGVEEEVTLEEMQKRAEKASGADQRFEEAARMRREAEEIARKAALPVQEVRQQPTVEDDDRALARALQMGSEEEAAAVIRKMRESQAAKPGQIAGLIDLTLAGNWFRQEYPDIFADPWLTKIALDEDERLVNQTGDKRSYKERYKAIGDKLREWKGTQAKVTAEKIERKANLQVVPKADVRQTHGAEDEDNKSDEQVTREVIAAEAKRRGQQYVR